MKGVLSVTGGLFLAAGVVFGVTDRGVLESAPSLMAGCFGAAALLLLAVAVTGRHSHD